MLRISVQIFFLLSIIFYFSFFSASHTFPYVKKRIEVVEHNEQELSPIEVAIDEIQSKTNDLNEVVRAVTPDVKKLQLNLQGCVSTQVSMTVQSPHPPLFFFNFCK